MRRRAHIDLDAILANAATAGSLTDLTADLRADAYGHGLIPVARALSAAGVGGFLVSRLEDAAALADSGLTGARVANQDARDAGAATGATVLGPELFGLTAGARAVPAMRLVGEVIAVKRVPADSGVSYGYTYRTRDETTLALVALGFADGLPRVATNKAPVRIGDFSGRITGRIAMDQFVVDLHGHHASPGDPAILFGDPAAGDPSVREWAEIIGIAAPVITSRLGRRIERVYSA
ncbi:hypothetical protein GCM10027406_16460 [Leifsonia lichenia]